MAFLGLGVAYSLLNPLFESPDEVWHYQYIKYVADGHGLPVSDLMTEMPWRQEGSQPPLYYLLGAGLTFWVDTGDAGAVIRYNPHAAMGVADAPDNKNVMVHDGWEAFPYRGTALAAHLARLLSVLMGAATVLCTYLTALVLFPGRRTLAAVAAAINAFNPQFIFISASVNNDNLVTLCCAATLLLTCLWWQTGKPIRLFMLGLVAGLAAISKLSGLVLLPFIALVLIAATRRRRSLRALAGWGVQVGLPFLAIAGWWYWRNWLLYHDPFGLAAMFAVLPARTEGPDTAELLARAEGVWRSTWAVFGWFNVVVDPWLYDLYTGLALSALAGLGFWVWWLHRNKRAVPSALSWLVLWSVMVVAALVGWSQKRYPQGRLLFPAISAAAVLLAAGLTQGGTWPRRWWQRTWAGMLSLTLFALAAWVPCRYIVPAYAPPPLLADLPSQTSPLGADFGGQVQLLGYELSEESVRPGEVLHLTLYWQAMASLDRDYSVFIHLEDENGVIVAQRDSYPAGGNAVTSRWPVGLIVPDRHTVQIPAIAPAPCQTRLRVGLYDYASGTRLLTTDGSDSVSLGNVSFLPAQGLAGLPNPVYFEFEGKLALMGFELDRRVMHPGETLHLTLYWRALSPMEKDYTVFTHLLLPPDQVWAQDDDQPQDGRAPTSSWRPGQVIEDHYQLVLPAEAPPGVYEVEVGLYWPATGDRLKVGFNDQGIVLGKVRVSE